MVNYIGTARIKELVSQMGPARFMDALAGEIEADYLRWSEFEKSRAPRQSFGGRGDRTDAHQRRLGFIHSSTSTDIRRTPPPGF